MLSELFEKLLNNHRDINTKGLMPIINKVSDTIANNLLLWYGYLKTFYIVLVHSVSDDFIKTKIHEQGNASINLKNYKNVPGPRGFPFIGNLLIMQHFDVPFDAFTCLSRKYGDLYKLQLGSRNCIIVSSLELIREILNENGKYFGGRPNFLRFHALFGGNRNNSLALCDWSSLQQRRRNVARRHCSPRPKTDIYHKLNDIGKTEVSIFLDHVKDSICNAKGDVDIKSHIQKVCANMFLQYMCSIRFDYKDKEFEHIVNNFDEIFWEINQGYAVDFLPWLGPYFVKHLHKIVTWSTEIRQFILKNIIDKRNTTQSVAGGDKSDDTSKDTDGKVIENDFTDALLNILKVDPTVSKDTIIFMLEDFIGGHSAIGNLIMIVFAYMIKHPEVANRIYAEIDKFPAEKDFVNMSDMDEMPYILATIYEVLRYQSSPIVPHVATEDTVISGYGIKAGTVIFINNYILNTGTKYWDSPEKFQPERFLETVPQECDDTKKMNSNIENVIINIDDEKQQNIDLNNTTNNIDNNNKNNKNVNATGNENIKSRAANEPLKYVTRVKKNLPHFLPFSIGKRTCIGQNLVRGFTFLILANLLRIYKVNCSDKTTIKIRQACVALETNTFHLSLRLRK